MAYSPSPTSPLTGRRSPTPLAQPLSKREKRKNQHNMLQQEMQKDFQNNREQHYRGQLIALQHDMNLVTQADPYGPEPLDDSPDEIDRMVQLNASGTPFQSEMSSLAGKWYSEFVIEVNEAKEHKEIELIQLQASRTFSSAFSHHSDSISQKLHEMRLERLKYECDYRLHLAAEECEHMTATLRERLVQSLSSKRQKLMKEKEQLDIADTNALLLHPSQFSITNPASPSGQTSRKTRTTRHRGDHEEPNGHIPENTGKRKRRAADDDYGSPSRNGHSTPAERAKLANVAHQTEKTYSVEGLFTDKERNFTSHQAQMASRHFFATSMKEGESNGASKKSKEEDDKSGSADDSTNEADDDLEAPGMERTASQNVHVTRSSRNIGGMAGLNILSDLAEKASTRPTIPYATLHTHAGRNSTVLPPPSRLMPEEVDEDTVKITQSKSNPEGFVDKKILEEALKPITGNRSMLAPDWPYYLDMHLVELDPRRRP